jgi:hypothetical protein
MNMQNVDAAIYAKAADAVAAGKYKLIYEKAGYIYGSKTGVPSIKDFCFNKPAKTTKAAPKPEAKKTADTKMPIIKKLLKMNEPTTDTLVEQPVDVEVEQNLEIKE